MNDALTLAFAFALAAGAALGAMFYGGLWWTVRRAVSSKRVALWFLVSLLLRMGLALAGLYFVSGGDWQRLLLCLLGFVLARLAVMWLTRPSEENRAPQPMVGEGSHAP
ncbi:N-ATPase subunit AtpR [Immundisolibacter sp.]|uniref:N-ATPase subunit AtpR n=1 Tax=Immundisolibacter sp. TaxID=1934948 RepID=UPI003F5094BD